MKPGQVMGLLCPFADFFLHSPRITWGPLAPKYLLQDCLKVSVRRVYPVPDTESTFSQDKVQELLLGRHQCLQLSHWGGRLARTPLRSFSTQLLLRKRDEEEEGRKARRETERRGEKGKEEKGKEGEEKKELRREGKE